MDMDEVLRIGSSDVFKGLEIGQKRILKFLAQRGYLNLTEIGQLTSHGTTNGFDRWGVKKRLEGTPKYQAGLIPNDYVCKIRVSKKEMKYGLTIKGLLASLSFLRFCDVYLVKHYKQILLKYSNDDGKAVEFILCYIKHEIAYLLYYNYIQGINWLKFRFFKGHIEQLRILDRGNFYLYFKFDRSLLNKKQKSTFECIQREYGDAYQLAGLVMGWVEPMKVYRSWLKKLKGEAIFNPEIKKTISLYLYGRLWHILIDSPKREMNTNQLVGAYLDFEGFDHRLPLLRMKKKGTHPKTNQSVNY